MIDIYQIRDSLIDSNIEETGFITSKGKRVEMVLLDYKVVILDCYKYEKIERFETLKYITSYLKKEGISCSRTINNLEAEWEVHKLAYLLNVETEKSCDVDLEFNSDSRWYVNTASMIVQFFGI